MQISSPHAEIRWKICCISSLFFWGWRKGGGLQGLGDFSPPALLKFISISGWSFKAHCYDHSRGGQHSLYSRGSNFILVHVWFLRSCFFFHLLKSKSLKFSIFVLKLYSFILSSKPWILLKGIFWLKRTIFFVCFAKLHSLNHLCHPLGCFGSCSTSCPDCSRHKKQPGRASTMLGSLAGVLSSPCHVGGMLVLAEGLSCCCLVTSCSCFAFPKGKGGHCVPAPISSLGNYVCSTSFLLLVQVFGLFDFTAPGLLRAGGADFRPGWSISPQHTLLLPGTMQKNPDPLDPSGIGI